jgi:SNF2 family DNA or RNA helicase
VKALQNYEDKSNSITFIQYQAGAMGLNLQKASRMIFFTLPLSSELYEQAKKRIHRIGQNKPCFYYQMICKGTVEEKILKTLEMRKDYTRKLFEKG